MSWDFLLNDALTNPWIAFLLIVTSFMGSAITASFSLGGGILLIAMMSIFMPANAIIPVHGAVLMGSNAGRATLLNKSIDWSVVFWFAIGIALGAVVGAQIVLSFPAQFIRIAIALFVLYSQWGKGFGKIKFGRHGLIMAGIISAILTLMVGATGPFITAILAGRKSLNRVQMVATAAASLGLNHLVKVIVFIVAGFVYGPWLGLIGASILAGFFGTWLGTKLLQRFEEKQFRTILKWLLSTLALYLLFLAISEIRAG